jgi:hypothetical protein
MKKINKFKILLIFGAIIMVSCIFDKLNAPAINKQDFSGYLYPTEILNNKDSLVNCIVSIRGMAISSGHASQTALACIDNNPCCNWNYSDLFISDSNNSIQVFNAEGYFIDSVLHRGICEKKECDSIFNCEGIFTGKEYGVTGTWRRYIYMGDTMYALLMNSYREIN